MSIKKVETVIGTDYPDASPAPSIVADDPYISDLWLQWLSDAQWTQLELSRRTGLSSSTIGHIVQGERRPSFITMTYVVAAISKRCGYEVGDMYTQIHNAFLREG